MRPFRKAVAHTVLAAQASSRLNACLVPSTDGSVVRRGKTTSASRPHVTRQSESAIRIPRGTAMVVAHTRMLKARVPTGEVKFFLERVVRGLYVEREELPRRGRPTTQILEFTEPLAFQRWCDGDSIRFEDPSAHVELKREADALWQIDSVYRG